VHRERMGRTRPADFLANGPARLGCWMM
jgi:hypothetical protein